MGGAKYLHGERIFFNRANFDPPAPEKSQGTPLISAVNFEYFLLFMFYNSSNIGFKGLLLFGVFVFVGIYGYTTLMDRKEHAVYIEVVRGIAGIALIWITKDWFGLDSIISWGSLLVASYFFITIFASIYFTYFEKTKTLPGLV